MLGQLLESLCNGFKLCYRGHSQVMGSEERRYGFTHRVDNRTYILSRMAEEQA